MPESSPTSDPVLPTTTAEASWHMDARIESALAWAAEQGMGDITLAIPYRIPDATIQALLHRGQIRSLVVTEPVPTPIDAEAVGIFLPTEFSWRLPAQTSHRILYVGTGSKISGRMIKASLRHGVRAIAYRDWDDWVCKPIPLLAIGKVRTKLLSYLQRGVDRLAGLSGLAPYLFEAGYRRRFRRTLTGAATIELPNPIRGRVVMVCPTLVAGGAERQIVNTAIGLREHGISDVTVLVANLHNRPGNDFFLRPLLNAGVQVQEIAGPLDSDREWDEYGKLTKKNTEHRLVRALLRRLPEELSQDVWNLFSIFRDLAPEVVHSWLDYSNVRAGLAAALAGVPRIVMSGRNVSPVHFPYIFKPYMRAAYQALLLRDDIKCVNNSLKGSEDYARWLGVPRTAFTVIYNGLDVSSTNRATPQQILDFRRRHSVPATSFLVGGMFRFSDEKRPLLWLETAALLVGDRPDLHCLLFGEGPCLEEMQVYVERRGLTERIRLALPTSASSLALSAFDALLLTSQWEGTPNVAIEAQAVGTPVIATGGGGACEALVSGQTGLFVSEPSAPELAAAVLFLLTNSDRYSAMQQAGPRFVRERFGMDRMIRETLNLYEIVS